MILYDTCFSLPVSVSYTVYSSLPTTTEDTILPFQSSIIFHVLAVFVLMVLGLVCIQTLNGNSIAPTLPSSSCFSNANERNAVLLQIYMSFLLSIRIWMLLDSPSSLNSPTFIREIFWIISRNNSVRLSGKQKLAYSFIWSQNDRIWSFQENLILISSSESLICSNTPFKFSTWFVMKVLNSSSKVNFRCIIQGAWEGI